MDLKAYFSRIGFEGAPAPDLDTFRALHLAHATHIPFENLDVQMGRRIHLDLDSIQAKLVARRRGGYCFEQNALFLAALREIGFDVEPFEARVRFNSPVPLPRTHMLLRVRLEGAEWLADVGFGGQGLLLPLPMDGEAHDQFGDSYRVIGEGPLQVLQSKQLVSWLDLYAFEPAPRLPVDFELGNWYTSTHPDSRFVTTLTAQLPMPEARHILRNLSYTVVRGGQAEERILQREELVPLLRDTFGLDVPLDAKFRALDS
jgi:N-hydroxyarylamine O-acetyltransferase